MQTVWELHPHLVEDVKRLHGEGYSHGKIAEQLGHGLTRCSVIGKVRRLGLPPNRTPKFRKPHPQTRPKRIKPAVRKPVIPPPAECPEPKGAVQASLNRGLCQYIHGELHENWRMCGEETGSITNSWCAYHRAKVFDKQRTKAANQASEARSVEAAQRRALVKAGTA